MSLFNRPNNPCENEWCGSTHFEKTVRFDEARHEFVPVWKCNNCPTIHPRRENQPGNSVSASQRRTIEKIIAMGLEPNWRNKGERNNRWANVKEEMVGDLGWLSWSGTLTGSDKDDFDLDSITVHVMIGRRGGFKIARENSFWIGDKEHKSLRESWLIEGK